MQRWIVTNMPSWLFLTILVVSIAAGTIAALGYVRHRYPGLSEGEHNDAARVAFSVVGPVYGFFIGFIISFFLGQITDTDRGVQTEGASAIQLARERNAFETADSDRILQSLLEYERSALDEWPQAANGRVAAETENASARLYTTYQNIQPRDDRQREALRTSLESLKQLSLARTNRLLTATSGFAPPLPLWSAIFLSSGLILGFSVVFGTQHAKMHFAMVAAVSVLVGVNLFLVADLAFPYVGGFATTPEPLRSAIEFLQTQ